MSRKIRETVEEFVEDVCEVVNDVVDDVRDAVEGLVEDTSKTAEKTPRDKYVSKGVRGVLVNLPLDVAEAFYAKARAENSKPTAVARKLIVDWTNS